MQITIWTQYHSQGCTKVRWNKGYGNALWTADPILRRDAQKFWVSATWEDRKAINGGEDLGEGVYWREIDVPKFFNISSCACQFTLLNAIPIVLYHCIETPSMWISVNAWTISGVIYKKFLTVIASREGNWVGVRTLFIVYPLYLLNCVSYACFRKKIIKQTKIKIEKPPYSPNTFNTLISGFLLCPMSLLVNEAFPWPT